MGVTLHIIKPSLSFQADFNGQNINIAVAPFAAMARDYGRFDMAGKKNRATKSCDRKLAALREAKEKGFTAEYVILNDRTNFDGACVYKCSSFAESFYDCDMGDKHRPYIGNIVNIDGKYRIIPKDAVIHHWIKENYPNAYQNSNSKHTMYQRINEHYKATVHCIGDLERYLNSEPEQVGMYYFQTYSPEQCNAPTWMMLGVISLKEEFIKKQKANLEVLG